MDVVKKVWDRPVHSDNAATILCRKFKLLRQELKAWSKNISRLSIAIENTNKALSDLDALENLRPLTLPEVTFARSSKTTSSACWIIKSNIGRNNAPFAGSNLGIKIWSSFRRWLWRGNGRTTMPICRLLSVSWLKITLVKRPSSFRPTMKG